MRRMLITLLFLGSLAGCSSSTMSSTTPSPALTFAGTWSGDLTVQGQAARMTWTLTQNGSSVSGPVLVGLANGVVLLNGALTGTLSGSTLTYSIDVSPGGIPTQPACTGRLDGTAAVMQSAPTSMTGSYTVATSTCATGFSSGNFTLTR